MCASYCRRAARSASPRTAAHQRQHSEMRWLLTNTALSSTQVSNPHGSTGDMVTVTWGLKPPLWFWCLNIRLFDMPLLFQVSLAGQDCEQISHKDFYRSAERQTSLSSLIKAELSFPLPCMLHRAAHGPFLLIWRLLVDFVENYSF